MITNKDMAELQSGDSAAAPTETTPTTPVSEVPATPSPESTDAPITEQATTPAQEVTPEAGTEPVVEKKEGEEVTPGEQTPQSTPTDQTPKPSRAERRIKRLTRERNEWQKKAEQFMSQTHEFPGPEGPKPFLEGDTIDLPALENYIGERSQQMVREALESNAEQTAYQERVTDWADDLAEVIADNPQLNPEDPSYDEEMTMFMYQTLEKANFDKEGKPDPKIYASDIWEQMQKAAQKTQAKAKEEGEIAATETLRQQQAEGAITPSPSKTPNSTAMSEEDKAALQAKDPIAYTKAVRDGKIR